MQVDLRDKECVEKFHFPVIKVNNLVGLSQVRFLLLAWKAETQEIIRLKLFTAPLTSLSVYPSETNHYKCKYEYNCNWQIYS